MAKRECGSCRFFEKSGVGQAGYCRNERCRDIVGIALVRKHELACRIGWDQDFYEAHPVAAIPGEERPRVDTSLQRGYQGMGPDDIIVAVEQVRPVTNESISQTTGRRPPSHVSEAHRRVLERKQQAQQTGTPVPVRRLEGVHSAPTPQQQPAANTSVEWEQTVTERVSPPRRPEVPPSTPTVFAPSEPVDVNARTISMPLAGAAGESSRPHPGRDELLPPVGVSRGEMPHPPEGDSAGPPGRSSVSPLAQTQVITGLGQPAPTGDHDVSLSEGPRPGDLHAQWHAAERQRHRGKRCGNCRDFRPPTEGSDHGYCKNRFAFPAPQIVSPSDLACLSAIGTWWAANDEWWLGHAAGATGNETPRVDQLLDELQAREEQTRPRHRPGVG